MLLCNQDIEKGTSYAFMLQKREKTSLVDLIDIADSMLAPYGEITDDMSLPPELAMLYDIKLNLSDRIQSFSRIGRDLSFEGRINCEEITIVDYGSGQGFASLCLLDWFLKKNGDLDNIKQVKLVDKDAVALSRALLHFSILFPSVDVIAYNDDLLSKGFSVDCNSVLTINLFSHILDCDIKILDQIKNYILNGHNLLMHNILLDEASSKSFPNKLEAYYFSYVINSIKDYTGCELIATDDITIEKRQTPLDKIKLFKYAVLSRTCMKDMKIPTVENAFTSLCPGEQSTKLINVPQRILWFERPLENNAYCDDFDDCSKISLKQNFISPLFKDEYTDKLDDLNPKSIKACAKLFHQSHIYHALSCGLPCGQEIVDTYVKAAEDGITEAYNNLGVLEFLDIESADQKGIDYFKHAADGGSDSAMMNLASYYMDNNEIETALNYYRKAADKGNGVALYNLALIMNFGLYNQSVDLNKAEALYRQCLKEFQKEEDHDWRNESVQNACCLNLMLLLYKKGEHYLKILDIYHSVPNPSDEVNYCKEILQIINVRRFNKSVKKLLSLDVDDDNERPYKRYNRAIFLYHGFSLKSFNVKFEKDEDKAIEIMKSLAEDENIDWPDRGKYVYHVFANWASSKKEKLGAICELYWRKAADIKPDTACASLTNMIGRCDITEAEEEDIWRRFAFGDGCKSCHECYNYNTKKRACPKAQHHWAVDFESQKGFAKKLIEESAEQLYAPALYHLGFKQAISDNMQSFKEDRRFNIMTKFFVTPPPEEYKPLFPILARDCYYMYLQKAADYGNRASRCLMPFVTNARADQYNYIFWAAIFNSLCPKADINMKHRILEFFQSKCNKSFESYFMSKTICEHEMVAIAEDIANNTEDTRFICQLGNFFLEGEDLYKARDIYKLAKEKGCTELDTTLDDINSRINEIEEEEARAQRWSRDERIFEDDTDYARDTWYAMTDGMYGDYPGGDVDYDIFGF